jgi:peroxiredoxin
MTGEIRQPTVGDLAPAFSVPALAGGTVRLAAYHGHRNVILWFSRGFTCPYCRTSMAGVIDGYRRVVDAQAEVIQVSPNLLESARAFFGNEPVPYAFICDPDKRLYAVYGLGDHGALAATSAGVVSFARAFTAGDATAQMRGAWFDVVNRNFLRRLHHHATSALEQGVFVIDTQGIIRHRLVAGPLDPIPGGAELADLVTAHCRGPQTPSPA